MKTEEKKLYTAPAMKTVELKRQACLMETSENYPGELILNGNGKSSVA
jgi:hypothetical protein